ncbi:hypothetical protein BGW42_001247 [Actinomortierella wolfii]|nr:hypothetical protein BGW42_001247 [Actinomortierella wolfii]
MKLYTASVWVVLLNTLTAGAPLGSTSTFSSSPPSPTPSVAPGNGNGICNTPACVQIAEAIARNMDPKADPCQDFYQFACGGFNAREQIPEDDILVSNMHLIQGKTDAVVRTILEADPSTVKGYNGTSLDSVSKAILAKSQAFYKSCMNETYLSTVGRKPLFDELQQLITTTFPVADSQLDSTFSFNVKPKKRQAMRKYLSFALAQFVRTGIQSFLSFTVTEDPANTTTQGVSLSEGGLTFPAKELYADSAVTQKLQELVTHMFTIAMGPQDDSSGSQPLITSWSAEVAKLAQDVVAFEIKLANISTDPQDRFNSSKSINPYTLSQLTELNPLVDWPLFLENTLSTTDMHDRNITVQSPTFVEKLGLLLNETTPTTLQNYFAWKIISNRALRLSSEYRRPLESFQAALSGVNPDIPPQRWETCVNAANAGLGAIIGHFYIAEVFPPESKKLGEYIIQVLEQVYLDGLSKLTWLDDQTRANAIAKLKGMQTHAGYSMFDPDLTSPSSLDAYYDGLEIDDYDFYGNQDRSTRWRVNMQLSQAGKPTNKRTMLSDPQVVDAFYNPLRNDMVFPAGILQLPFFSTLNPEYLNFGGMGVVAGHEITHGFDSNGRTYDASGTYVDWWTDATSAQFISKAQCFIDQYSNFSVPNPTPGGAPVPVNGHLTLSENLADNGGVKKSFEAWQKRFESDPQGQQYNNQLLAGLETYTREQLFFVAYGQIWCAKVRPEALVQYVLTDTHSPPVARVNGPVQNSHAFAKAFNCGASAPMNPAKKCEIW